MTSGLQVWNDQNYMQVDGLNQHIVLLRKGTAIGTTLANGRTDIGCCAFTVPVNPGEIVAFNGPAPITIAGKYAGSWNVFMFGAGPGSALNYWVFGPYTPSGIRYGMEIYDDNQTLIYDTGRLPIRVVGEVAGLGDFTVGSPGRQYAIVPWMLFTQLTRTSVNIPGSGGFNYLQQSFSAGIVGIQPGGQNVHSENITILATVAGPVAAQSIPFGWVVNIPNNLQNTVSVIDVTNY
jgi:hypothetical protein